MKKIFTTLIFLSFLVTSQMQLVHAFDMGQMNGHDGMQMNVSSSIFCVNTKSENTKTTSCIKEIIPDKSLFTKGIQEVKAAQIVFPSTVFFVLKNIKNSNWSTQIATFYRYRFKSKSSYDSLVGNGVKNLN